MVCYTHAPVLSRESAINGQHLTSTSQNKSLQLSIPTKDSSRAHGSKPAHEDRYRWAMLKVRRVFRPTIMGNAC